MSYEHGTPHYNLPQTVGSDTRDWFDTNEAFADIDAAIHSASQTAETAAQDLDGVKSDVQGLKDADIAMTGRVDGIEGRVGASEQAIGRLQQDVADVDTDLKDSICAIEEASATAAYQHLTGTFFWYNDTLYKATQDIGVGNQIVPDTNCTTTNITTELLEGGSGDLEPRVAKLETDMGTLMFRVDGGNAQYSKDGGTTWVNFKNPVGTKSITANGTYDVTDYASAAVNVPNMGQFQWMGFADNSRTLTLDHDTNIIYVCESIAWTYSGTTFGILINGVITPIALIKESHTGEYGLHIYKVEGTFHAGDVIGVSGQSQPTYGACVFA